MSFLHNLQTIYYSTTPYMCLQHRPQSQECLRMHSATLHAPPHTDPPSHAPNTPSGAWNSRAPLVTLRASLLIFPLAGPPFSSKSLGSVGKSGPTDIESNPTSRSFFFSLPLLPFRQWRRLKASKLQFRCRLGLPLHLPPSYRVLPPPKLLPNPLPRLILNLEIQNLPLSSLRPPSSPLPLAPSIPILRLCLLVDLPPSVPHPFILKR